MKPILTTTSRVAALLAAPALAQTTVVTGTGTVAEVQSDPATSGGGAAGGAATGAVAGAAADAVMGDVREDALTPETRTYILDHRSDPVVIKGGVAVGAQLPETVQVQTIPDGQHGHVHVGERPVLVDPQNRQVIQIIEQAASV